MRFKEIAPSPHDHRIPLAKWEELDIERVTAIHRIDVALRLNYGLVADSPHPAVDYRAVWRQIDSLLDRRSALTSMVLR